MLAWPRSGTGPSLCGQLHPAGPPGSTPRNPADPPAELGTAQTGGVETGTYSRSRPAGRTSSPHDIVTELWEEGKTPSLQGPRSKVPGDLGGGPEDARIRRHRWSPTVPGPAPLFWWESQMGAGGSVTTSESWMRFPSLPHASDRRAHRAAWPCPVHQHPGPHARILAGAPHPPGEGEAFATPDGLYQYRVLPFGVHGAPATFQRLMDRVLRPHQQYVAAYLNDIVVHSETWKDHVSRVEAILQALREAGLTANPAKCHLGMEVTWSGRAMCDPRRPKWKASLPGPHPAPRNRWGPSSDWWDTTASSSLNSPAEPPPCMTWQRRLNRTETEAAFQDSPGPLAGIN